MAGSGGWSAGLVVALLAEGVDRNELAAVLAATDKASPSSRRAWIEIARAGIRLVDAVVALLAEGVDRNSLYHRQYTEVKSSPSSRRAWIEIATVGTVSG